MRVVSARLSKILAEAESLHSASLRSIVARWPDFRWARPIAGMSDGEHWTKPRLPAKRAPFLGSSTPSFEPCWRSREVLCPGDQQIAAVFATTKRWL